MAGRGRDMVKPAWMTEQEGSRDSPSSGHVPGIQESGRYASPFDRRGGGGGGGDRPRDDRGRDRGGRDRRYDRDRPRDDRGRRSSRRDGRYERSRSRDRRDRSRRRERTPSPNSDEERRLRERRERRRAQKKSNWDVKPTEMGSEVGSAAAEAGALAAAALTGGAVPSGGVTVPTGINPTMFTLPGGPQSQLQTRHARRLYVGGIGDEDENDLAQFFNEVISKALHKDFSPENSPVLNVYINRERRFAFVELNNIELTTACMALDGIEYRGHPLKIRRPNDYNPAMVPPSSESIKLDLSALGVVSTTVPDSPNKIFIGGIPYSLDEKQVMELLQAFGRLKAFHLVREAGSNQSKGYAFAEYMDPSVTDKACSGLDGLPLLDRNLTVRRAQGAGSNENNLGAMAAQGMAAASALAAGGAGVPMGVDQHGGFPPQFPPPPAAGGPPMPSNGTVVGSVKPTRSPTNVVLLKNMVTLEELRDDSEYQDIMLDVKDECSKFGPVLKVVIPREGVESVGIGRVFVEFDQVPAAQAAADALGGRKFAERTVESEFYPPEEFAAGRYGL